MKKWYTLSLYHSSIIKIYYSLHLLLIRIVVSIHVQYVGVLSQHLRDWSLITGRGGYEMGGGALEDFPLRKGGGEKSFSHVEGGGAKKVLG